MFLLSVLLLLLAGCGQPETPSVTRFVEGLMQDMQERAFERMYEKLTSERRREVSQEEYVRNNSASFEKMDALGGYLDDFQIDENGAKVETDRAEVAVHARVVFQGKSGPSEHRRRLVFDLVREPEGWKFDSFRSYELP